MMMMMMMIAVLYGSGNVVKEIQRNHPHRTPAGIVRNWSLMLLLLRLDLTLQLLLLVFQFFSSLGFFLFQLTLQPGLFFFPCLSSGRFVASVAAILFHGLSLFFFVFLADTVHVVRTMRTFGIRSSLPCAIFQE